MMVEAIKDWNKFYSIGTRVKVRLLGGKTITTITESSARMVGDAAKIKVRGFNNLVDFELIEAVH